MNKIIIQAGGKGTRLESLTVNKPKCMVPVDNLPIIFHLFDKFPEAEFQIITDYKSDVLEKYLKTFGEKYNYNLIKPVKSGTISGIKEALKNFQDNESVFIVWCDLILPETFEIPLKKGNYIGISKNFECRWSYINGKLIKSPSKENGVAGLFIFENKQILENIEEEGAFVEWLQKQNIKFRELPLNGTKEIGTVLAYNENNTDKPCCRPFNKITLDGNIVTKCYINEQGKEIAKDEIAWYQHVKSLGYKNIPDIYNYEPLQMRQINGKNIYEYDFLTYLQKEELLKNLIQVLKDLHKLEPGIPVNMQDMQDNYIDKTFKRLSKVRDLIPFADKEFVKINGQYYKNIFFCKDELAEEINLFSPSEFKLIHGDCTFSNIMFDTFNLKVILIDPRGYFGKTKLYGDEDYDWAKLYYSLKGNYDQFNRKKFMLDIGNKEVKINIKSNNWEDMEDLFFEYLPPDKRKKIKLLHAIIWLSLTTYAWEDYDSICGAFYNGLIHLSGVIS